MAQDWYFYMVRCNDGSLYSGITNDLIKRIATHNSGKGAKYTASRRPVELVYQESCADNIAAKKREAEVKSWPKIKKEKLVQKCYDLSTNQKKESREY